MTIANPSFEAPGLGVGEAAGWGLVDLTALVEVAEFGEGLGFDRFEAGWNLPLGLNRELGVGAEPTIWASILNGAPTINPAPASDYVATPFVGVASGLVPPGGVVVTLTYTNEFGTPGRTATVSLPAGTDGQTVWAFTLESEDKGFQAITGLSTAPALPSTELNVLGSWQLQPQNDGYLSAFQLPNLEVGLFPVSSPEGFEAGWNNDPGLLNNFAAIASEAAQFDPAPQAQEDFEEKWNLPQPAAAVTNETKSFGHEPFIDSSFAETAYGFFNIVAGVNDQIALRWGSGGTLADLSLQLSPGLYGARTAHLQAVAGSLLVDGETFVINPQVGPAVTFEFDSDASVIETPTLRAVPFTAMMDASQVRDAMLTAINDAPSFDVTARSRASAALLIDHDVAGLLPIVSETVADPGFVLTPALAREIEVQVRAGLTADPGPAAAGDFQAFVTPAGRIRLEGSFDPGGGRPTMELLAPASDSAWPTLGFAPGRATQRAAEPRNLAVASFDAAPQAFEDWEQEWRSNQDAIFAFGGGDLEAALFDAGLEAFEDFENDWLLVLP